MKRLPLHVSLLVVGIPNVLVFVFYVHDMSWHEFIGVTVLAIMLLALNLFLVMYPEKHPRGFSLTASLVFVTSVTYGTSGVVFASLLVTLGYLCIRPRLCQSDAKRFADEIRVAVSEHRFDGMECMPFECITGSIGVTTNAMADGKNQLLEHADQALYAAKDSGKNNVLVFTSQLAKVT